MAKKTVKPTVEMSAEYWANRAVELETTLNKLTVELANVRFQAKQAQQRAAGTPDVFEQITNKSSRRKLLRYWRDLYNPTEMQPLFVEFIARFATVWSAPATLAASVLVFELKPHERIFTRVGSLDDLMATDLVRLLMPDATAHQVWWCHEGRDCLVIYRLSEQYYVAAK